MKINITRIGDLPCLQDMDLSQNVGDLDATIIYPDYEDGHFPYGFGVRTQTIDGETHEEIFSKESASIDARRIRERLLDTLGCWQVNHQDCIDVEGYGASLLNRVPRSWHTDGLTYITLIGNSEAEDPTYVAPIIKARIQALICAPENALEQIIKEDCPTNDMEMFEIVEDKLSERKTQEIIEQIQKICNQTQPLIENNYATHSTLAFCDENVAHATPANGGILWTIDE